MRLLPVRRFLLLLCLSTSIAWAQDIEPRRWSHLPVDANFLSVAVVDTEADIFFDPVLRVEEAEGEFDTAMFSYFHGFEFMGKSARVDVRLPYQKAHWTGMLDGEPRTAKREGFDDPRIRFSLNLIGAPPLKGEKFQTYQANNPTNTIVGAAVAITLPFGEYIEEEPLNIGKNRFVIRPQFGVVHSRGKWAYELTGSVFLYTDNDEYVGDGKREQDPLYATQAHLIYTFRPGLWISLSAAYAWDGESTVNGIPQDDSKRDFLSALSVGIPINRNTGLRFVYLRNRTHTDIGSDSDSISLAFSRTF